MAVVLQDRLAAAGEQPADTVTRNFGPSFWLGLPRVFTAIRQQKFPGQSVQERWPDRLTVELGFMRLLCGAITSVPHLKFCQVTAAEHGTRRAFSTLQRCTRTARNASLLGTSQSLHESDYGEFVRRDVLAAQAQI